MADFPTSPTTGDFFVTPGATYKYTGNAWTVVGPDTGVRISSVQEISATASAPVEEIVGVKSITLQSGSVNAEPDVGKLFIEDNGVDSYTKLLLHFDGADEATSTTDSSDSGHTITMTGVKIDNGASVFGTSSAYFDGTDDYISAPASSDFDFGTGAFTIEFWFKANQTNSFERFVSFGTSSSPFYFYTVAYQPSGQKYEFVVYNGGSWETTGRLLQADASDIEADVWTHLALVRESGDSDPKLYINGVERSFTAHASSQSMPSLSFSSQSGALMKIGSFMGSVDAFAGYLEEVRISKGVARYTSNFELPTKQFGRPDLKVKDSSGDYIIKLKQIN